MKHRRVFGLTLGVMLLISVVATSFSQSLHSGAGPLETRAFSRSEISIIGANVPLRDITSLLPNALDWDQFLSGHDPHTRVYIDPRSGVASGITTREPIIPGKGKGNHLTLRDLGRTLGEDVSTITPDVVGRRIRLYLLQNHKVIGLDPDQMGTAHAVKITDDLWDIEVPQVVHDIPVRFARAIATVSRGNLVLIGAEMWGHVHIDTHPVVTAEDAVVTGFAQFGGRGSLDSLWKKPMLEILPVAPEGREKPYVHGRRPGDGYDHWLVWSIGLKHAGDPGTWEVLVNAHSGDVVAVWDLNLDETRQITGTVYPVTNTTTGTCQTPDRCGIAQPDTPMPFVDYSPDLPGHYSNSAGLIFDFSGPLTTSLHGRYISVDNGLPPSFPTCGPLSESVSSGDLDLGGSTSDHDCTTPGQPHSPGDTPAARTAFYELNRIRELASKWLPDNPWLQGDLGPQVAHVNNVHAVGLANAQFCNAWYDPVEKTLNFSEGHRFEPDAACCSTLSCTPCPPGAQQCDNDRCPPGTACGTGACCPQCARFECSNLGEIATVLDHEWGHALDDNDGSVPYTDSTDGTQGLTMSKSSEAYADITAAYRTQTSCSGYGFLTTHPGDDQGCGYTQDSLGFNGNTADPGKPLHCLTDCSGKRDSDYRKHNPSTPDTPTNFVLTSCGHRLLHGGPCGLEEHCEAAPSTQAAWDLAAYELESFYGYSRTKSFNVASRLHFQGSSGIQSWHTCDGHDDGCGAGSAYLKWLVADDDNSNLDDGTPHMRAIYAAFNNHGIACDTPIVQDSGCSGSPTSAPQVTATPSSNQIILSWSNVSGASTYLVYRSDGPAGCDMGRTLIGTTPTNSFTDPGTANDRNYYYTVEAAGNSDRCSGPTSTCLCARYPSLSAVEICNGIDDNCNGQVDEGFADLDGDGYAACVDCDDNNPSVHPGAAELCDNLDNDCNGVVDDVILQTCGVGACQRTVPTCDAGVPQTCTPGNPTSEICDGIDNDCDGETDEGFADLDGDGYAYCVDCDDNNPSIHPGAAELCDNLDNDCNGVVDDVGFHTCGVGACQRTVPICISGATQTCVPGQAIPEVCNGIDDNCDGIVDNNLGEFACGVGACQRLASCVDGVFSCTPGSPTTEVCNGVDDDCNGQVDEGFDADGDGYITCGPARDCDDSNPNVNPGAPEVCNGVDDNCNGRIDEDFDVDSDGYTTCGGDCNDNNAAIHPGGVEVCNGVDDNCNGIVDEGFDADGDGYSSCNGDCNDGNPAIHLDAPEICNGIDDNCDGQIDEDFDGDGFTSCAGDCNDNDPSIYPGAVEVCNGVDDNCNGTVDEGFDIDGDGSTSCGGDCNDSNPAIHPGSREICNGIDDNCDGRIDEDFDQDGYTSCQGDCNDNNPLVHPGATEICNGLDDNCDGHIDEGFPDADADGLANCIDPCTDTDHDGFGNPGFSSNTCTLDNCPTVSNPTQADADADGVGNACDTCTDTDGDGFGNPGYSANTCDLDNCPTVSNPTQADADDDGIGDACDTCTDPDFDGYGNPGFGCSGCAAHPNHPDNCPTIYNPNQADADSDHIGDVCDTCTDTDQDGYGNPGYSANTCVVDNCPTVANASQANADGDSLGDACDTCTDTDGDGFGNPGYSANTCAVDNCPTVSNSTQADGDNDGVGNACDNCPSDYNPTQAYVGNPIVQVLYPNGGETLHVGSTATLTWTASDTCGGVSSVDILISRDGVTGSYTTLFTGLANTGSKTWTVTAPTTAPNKVFIKVIAHDPAGNSGQDTGNSGARITN